MIKKTVIAGVLGVGASASLTLAAPASAVVIPDALGGFDLVNSALTVMAPYAVPALTMIAILGFWAFIKRRAKVK